MKRCLLAALAATLSAPAFPAEHSAANSGEEKCIYDQEEQKKVYLELQEKYAGSRYIEDEYKLVIPDDENQVTLRRGGCVHFGISIEFRIARTERYDDEAVFLSKVRGLIKEYGQELADQEILDNAIDNEARHVTRDDTGAYYFLPYPDATFEIFLRHDPEHTTIGINFYY